MQDYIKSLKMIDECLNDGIPIEKNDPIHKKIKQVLESQPEPVSEKAEEVLRKHFQKAIGEQISDENWQEVKSDNSDVGKLFHASLDAMQEFAHQERQQSREETIQEFEKILGKIKYGLQQMIDEAPNMLSPDGRFGERAEDRNHGIEQGAKLALTMVNLIQEKELENLKKKAP